MGRVSSKTMNEVAKVLCSIRDVELMHRFLESILTPRELEEIGGRWEIVKLLERGVSQRQVAKKLRMSLCKITRGSRELKKKDSTFKRVLGGYPG